MKKGKDIIVNVFSTLLIVFLIVSILSNFQTMFLGKKYNQLFGYTLFEIKTASMSGKIEIGDWIVVKITDDVKLNDIITYEQEGSFITHRLIERYNESYITKGDSNNTKDNPISKNQIVGKVVKVMPKFGIYKKTLFNPWVLLSLFVTLIIYCNLFNQNNNYLNFIKKKFVKKKKDPDAITKENIEYVKSEFKNIKNPSSKTQMLSKIKVNNNNKQIYECLDDKASKKNKKSDNIDDMIDELNSLYSDFRND